MDNTGYIEHDEQSLTEQILDVESWILALGFSRYQESPWS
jgi:hypothetical protein